MSRQPQAPLTGRPGRSLPGRTMLLLLVLVLSVGIVAIRDSAAPAQGSGSGRSWLALGDSYSSGEGIPGADRSPGWDGQDCERANGTTGSPVAKAWPVVAFDAVKQQGGFDAQDFVACTGNVTDDWSRQVDEATSHSGRTSWDVISLSFGGNNIGFAKIIAECIDLDTSKWQHLLDPTPGCDISRKRLFARIDALGGDRSADPDIDVGLTLPELYDHVAEKVRPGGQVIVAGYPRLVEEQSRWARWQRAEPLCQGIFAKDIPLLRDATDRLNDRIRERVEEADTRWEPQGVSFVFADLADKVYETSDDTRDRHGLCADQGAQWLNGITPYGQGSWRKERSFHPTQQGHTATGRYIATYRVGRWLKKPRGVDWRNSQQWVLGPRGLGPLVVGDLPTTALRLGVVRPQRPEGCFLPYRDTGILDRDHQAFQGVATYWDTGGSAGADVRLTYLSIDSGSFRTTNGSRVGLTVREVARREPQAHPEKVLYEGQSGTNLVIHASDGHYVVFIAGVDPAGPVVQAIGIGQGIPAAGYPC